MVTLLPAYLGWAFIALNMLVSDLELPFGEVHCNQTVPVSNGRQIVTCCVLCYTGRIITFMGDSSVLLLVLL